MSGAWTTVRSNMPKSKKYKVALAKVDKNKKYLPLEALKLAKETSTTKFDSSIELHMLLGIDQRQGDQQVRSTVILPHGAGKTKIIAAFVEPSKVDEAKKAGADIVGGEELIQTIKQTGKIDFTETVATPAIMPKLAQIAKLLGPKGLMPSPKSETVGVNIGQMVTAIKKGKISYKNDNTGNLHLVIGKTSFTDDQLLENFTSALESIKKSRPSSAKGIFIKKAFLATTMGPSIALEIAQ